MEALLARIGALPIGMALGLLFLVVLVRSHATYWAGRGVVAGAEGVGTSSRSPQWYRSTLEHLDRWTSSHAARRGLDLVRRWGAPAVTAAYLTIGLQTAVFAASGLIRMPYGRFTIASIPGSVAWAVVWGTVGFGAFYAAVSLVAASPWAALGVAVVLLVVGGFVWRRRLLRRARRDAADA
ncbi:hypothetical protein, partial [Cellulomonas massiliensis]|uniref:hypothetical protein n=1 Tax=Cellulomonas massiliensis TaxID=1465811 RepID=UPI00037CC6B9